MRDFLSVSLVQYGAQVSAFATTAEALQALEEQRPHVLVSDIGMPGEDGYDFIRRVRALDPERGGQTPAAALTAHAKGEDGARVLHRRLPGAPGQARPARGAGQRRRDPRRTAARSRLKTLPA